MKIELFHASLNPSEGGGTTIQDDVLAALGSLEKCDHEFHVFQWEPVPLGAKFGKNIRCISLQRSLSARLLGRVAYQTQSIAARFRGQPPPPFPFESQLAATRRKMGIQCALVLQPFFLSVHDQPYIATVWDLEHRIKPIFPEVSDQGVYGMRERHFQDYLGRAARIVVGTEEGRRQIERFYGIPTERIAVLPMPTPAFALEIGSNCGRRPGTIPSGLDDNFIFYPAQFWAHKNHIALLHALAGLQSEHGMCIPLVLSGADKGNRAHIQSVAANLGLQNQVHFAGFVSRDELIWLYRHCLALGFVSFFGPDNLPPLEAFALGCPVVAARLNGVEEQLGDAAILVDPCNEREIADAFRRLASDAPLRNALVRRGLDRARRSSPHRYAQQLCAVIDELGKYRRCWQ